MPIWHSNCANPNYPPPGPPRNPKSLKAFTLCQPAQCLLHLPPPPPCARRARPPLPPLAPAPRSCVCPELAPASDSSSIIQQ